MLVPSVREQDELKDNIIFNNIRTIVFQGYSVEEYYNRCIKYLCTHHIPYIFIYFFCMTAVGVLGILDGTKRKYIMADYINIFLVVYYGIIPVCLVYLVYFRIGILSMGKSKFIYFFYKAYGEFGIISFFMIYGTGILIIGLIVHMSLIWVTMYLYNIMLSTVLITGLIVINSIRVCKRVDTIENELITEVNLRNRENPV